MSEAEDYQMAKERTLEAVRTCLQLSQTSRQRADFLDDVAVAVRDHVKFRAPGGEGLDGRDGPERQSLTQVLIATADHASSELSRSIRP